MQAAAGCFGLVCGYLRSATAVVELEPAGVVLQTLMRDGSALLLHFSQSIRARQYGTCQEAFLIEAHRASDYRFGTIISVPESLCHVLSENIGVYGSRMQH